jgi:ParB-like chromosome segregation protein Spo0J
LKPKVIAALKDSIVSGVGIIEPPVVRRDGKGFRLIAGANRIEAARQLGHKTIGVEIRSGKPDRDRDELAQIDENLVRMKLTPSEEAKVLKRRKAIYEAKHPETKGGVAGGKAGGNGRAATAKTATATTPCFTADTAAKTGRSERAIRQSVRRAAALGLPVIDKVRGTSLDKPKELDALIKMPETDRSALVERAAAGEHVSAVAATQPAVPLGLKRLNRAWDVASPAEREAFCLLRGLFLREQKAS